MSDPRIEPMTWQVYYYIRDFHRREGFSPSLREIGEGCYIAHTTALNHIARLEGMGWVVREVQKPRSIRLAEHAPDYPVQVDKT